MDLFVYFSSLAICSWTQAAVFSNSSCFVACLVDLRYVCGFPDHRWVPN
jgi:hypothetical protein